MSEFKEIDLTQLQKVEVRDYEKEDWTPAYYLALREELYELRHRVLISTDGFEYAYIENYRHCRPYKEPTKRPMTDREIFNALKKEDCWLKHAFSDVERNLWKSNVDYDDYRITYDGGETWNKLEVEE